MKAALILTTCRKPATTNAILTELQPLVDDGHILLHSEQDAACAKENGWDAVVEPSQHLTVWLNRCVKAVDADVYVWVHDDMVFYDGWLDNMLAFMEKHPDVWYAAPHNWHNPARPQNYGDPFDDSYWLTNRVAVDADEVQQYMVDHVDEYEVGSALPACIRREVFEELGYYDERFILIGGYEDLDMQRRVAQHGKTVAIYHGSVAWHRGMGTRDPRDPEGLMNKNVFKLKHGILWDKDILPSQRDIMEKAGNAGD